MINIILFSKDRPAQLELLLRSMKLYFKEFNQNMINILYTYSNNDFKKGYDKLFTIHNDSNINYIKETDKFKSHVINLLNPENSHSIFFVDDDVFKMPFTLNCKQFKLFTMNDDILTLSLRIHPYLTYCYSLKIRTTAPHFNSDLTFKWYREQGDFGYPMSLDGHFFRTSDILPLTSEIAFNNPNTYESVLAGYTLNRSKIICFENSIIVNNPLNRVQNIFKNVHGNISADFINDKFLDDYVIDLDNFKGILNSSCHQEIDIKFIKNNININETVD
jgi:hypothetical protein